MIKFIERVLNISHREIPGAFYAWGLMFLHRLGLIIGITTLTAMFVTQFGIENLPVMLLLQAVLTILGMLVFSFLSSHFSTKLLIPACAFAMVLVLFISTFFVDRQVVFFSLLLLVSGIFLPQLSIFLANYLEDFFTPLECERIFPVIESAQTIGGIFGGLLIAALSQYIGSYKFFYLWILFLFVFAAVIFILDPFSREQHAIFEKQEKFHQSFKTRLDKFTQSLKELTLVPFLQGLLIVFLFHWVVGHIIEFQYTKIIDESVSDGATSLLHEESLAYGLGSFQILFHGSALIVQLLVASRILRKLGTVGSFLLHAIVTFLSSVSLLLGFGYFTVILSKNNFELSGIIHKNAYESSYYALRHGTQRQTREFFEAFVYPFGTILGTSIILAVQSFFLPEHTFLALQIILVFFTVGMIVFSLRLQRSYTKLSKNNLLNSNHHITKLHAIEILSQKGHRNHLSALIKALKNPREPSEIKVKILNVLQKISDSSTIPDIIPFLHSSEEDLVYASVRALGAFAKLDDNIYNHAFSKYRVVHELKKLFSDTQSEKVRESVIHALASLGYEDIVPFLLNAMKGASQQFQIACIQVCSLFHDPALADYLLPMLKSYSPFVRANTVLALWQFPAYRNRLQSTLHQLYHSTKREDFLAYCSVIGDIGIKVDQKKLFSRFDVLDPVLKLTIGTALFKLGNNEVLTDLVHLLFSKNSLVLCKARELFASLNPDKRKFLQKIIQHEVSQRLHPVFSSEQSILTPISKEIIKHCKDIYRLLDLHKESESLSAALELQ